MTNILKLSEAAIIGFHSLILIARNPQKILSAAELAKELGVSLNHLSKVMQKLVKNGILASSKGKGGGFKMIKTPDEILLMDIYELIDGKYTPSGCFLNWDNCGKNKCVLGELVRSINKQFESHFKNTKLSEIL